MPKKSLVDTAAMDDLAMTALAEATKEFHGDTHRTYLTGLSMEAMAHGILPRSILERSQLWW